MRLLFVPPATATAAAALVVGSLFDGDTPLAVRGMNADATSLAVTVEPDGGSPQSTSQPVVQLALKSLGFGE